MKAKAVQATCALDPLCGCEGMAFAMPNSPKRPSPTDLASQCRQKEEPAGWGQPAGFHGCGGDGGTAALTCRLNDAPHLSFLRMEMAPRL
jgi:hypothetical protein